MSPPASRDHSNPRPLNSTLRNSTLRRCWGALKETVDALGAAWDAYDNDAEDPEANTSCRSDARPPSAPISPKRPSLDIFKTPPSRPAHESAKSYRTHYDTLTDSPTTSRSSRRKRKTNPRRSNPTPTRRRNQNGGIDHSYSTDEDDCGPHVRLLNRLFYQGPPHALDDKVCVFAFPQGEKMENTKPNENDGKIEVALQQPAKNLDGQMVVVPDESDKASSEQLYSDWSLREDPRLQDEDTMPVSPHAAHGKIESILEDHDEERIRAHRRDALAQLEGRAPHPQSRPNLMSITWAPLPNTSACPQVELTENNKPRCNDSKEEVTSDQPENPWSSCGAGAPIDERISVPSDDVDGASLEAVCSDRDLHDQCGCENLYLEDEDPMPINPHAAHGTIESGVDETNHANIRDTLSQHEGDAPVSSFSTTIAALLRHLSERVVIKIATAKCDLHAWRREIPSTGLLDVTLPTRTCSETQSFYADSGECVPEEEQGRIDAWLDHIVPLETIPNEALRDGKKLPMPHSETRKSRLKRRATSCVILSAAIPPELDVVDLLTTPLGFWWPPTEYCESPGVAASGSEETLMSTFGITCDFGMADHRPEPIVPSADDVISRSAAMGSMVKLQCTDAEVRRSVETASRARIAIADDRNLWWHCVNNAKGDTGSFCWSVMLDMCELPPDFQEDGDPKAPVNRAKDLYRTIYDFYNMHHGDGSDMDVPQKFTIHNYYMHKLELHTRSVWEMFMSRWVPNVNLFPPANPVSAAAEAYIQLAIKDHPRCGSMFRRNESPVNALSKYVTHMPKHLWRQKEDRMRFVLDNGLKCFAQLVFIRCKAMRFEVYLIKHPDVIVPAQLP
jgi:hypothetical protein